MAVACLVFINGATLTPLVVPPEMAAAATASADEGAPEASPWQQYERDGDDGREPAVVAAVPPLVKNLRRPAPTRQFKGATTGPARHPADAPGPTVEFLHRVLAANAADLTRLCRLLL